jgi:hypothetical protein
LPEAYVESGVERIQNGVVRRGEKNKLRIQLGEQRKDFEVVKI